MASLSRIDLRPRPLQLAGNFRPCEVADGDELYRIGIFEINVTRLIDYICSSENFSPEPIALTEIPLFGTTAGLDGTTVASADLDRPVLLAEVAPRQFSLADGHHRIARAQRERVTHLRGYRVWCPEHIAFLTSRRGYEAYVEYWNEKVDALTATSSLGTRPRSRRIHARSRN